MEKKHIKLEYKMWTIIFLDSDLFCYTQNIHILTQVVLVSIMCLEV